MFVISKVGTFKCEKLFYFRHTFLHPVPLSLITRLNLEDGFDMIQYSIAAAVPGAWIYEFQIGSDFPPSPSPMRKRLQIVVRYCYI